MSKLSAPAPGHLLTIPRSPVLVLMMDKHLGDFINSLSTLKDLQSSLPGEVTLVVDENHRVIVEASRLRNVIYYPRQAIGNGKALARLRAGWKFIGVLRAKRAATVIDVGGSVASTYTARMCGAKIRVGPENANKAQLYNRPVKQNMTRLRAYHYADIAGAIGVESQPLLCRLSPPPAAKRQLADILANAGVSPGDSIVVIHPGGGKPYKCWAPERFAGVAATLAERGYQVVLVAATNEKPVVDELMAHLDSPTPKNITNLCGNTDLGQLLALLEQSVLFIGNDSGPMHLACCFDSPVIAIFGATFENIWGPLAEHAAIVKSALGCGDCPRKGKCKFDFRCMKAISVEQVLATVDTIEATTTLAR